MSIGDFDYDNDTTAQYPKADAPDKERDDAWYKALVAEIQTPGTVAYTSTEAAEDVTEDDLKEAAVNEAIMRMELRKRGNEIDEETAAVMVMPDYVAVCFMVNGKRFTARLKAGDLLVLTPEILFSQGPN